MVMPKGNENKEFQSNDFEDVYFQLVTTQFIMMSK